MTAFDLVRRCRMVGPMDARATFLSMRPIKASLMYHPGEHAGFVG